MSMERSELDRSYLRSQLLFYRVLRGMRQSELATASRVAESTISRLETSNHNTDLDRIYRIASALGVPPAALFTPPMFVLYESNTELLVPLFRHAHTLPDHVLQVLVLIAEAFQAAQAPARAVELLPRCVSQ